MRLAKIEHTKLSKKQMSVSFVVQNSDMSKKKFQGKVLSEVLGFYDGLALVNVDLSPTLLQESFPISDISNVQNVVHKSVPQKDMLCFCDDIQNLSFDPTVLSKIKQLHVGIRLNGRKMEEEMGRLQKVYSELQKEFVCLHLRINNNQSYITQHNSRWPEAFELTWVRKSLVDTNTTSDFVGCFPTEIDEPVNPKKASQNLRGFPFCKSI